MVGNQMFDRRRRFHDLMDELDKFIGGMERDIERTLRSVYESQSKFISRPMVYGFSMKFEPDGEPIIRSFGDKDVTRSGFREPVYDQYIDEGRGELKLFVELPGIEKQNIELRSAETHVTVSAIQGERNYKAEVPLKAPIEVETAAASYGNGVLEVTFALKGKANKGFKKINVE